MIPTLRLALWGLCALVGGSTPAGAYDIRAGQQKAEEACAPCHGKGGVSEQPAVPSISGQWNDYVVLALFQFRAGHRPSEAMAQFAKPLTDKDLGNLAAYYSGLKPWTPTRQSSAAEKAESGLRPAIQAMRAARARGAMTRPRAVLEIPSRRPSARTTRTSRPR